MASSRPCSTRGARPRKTTSTRTTTTAPSARRPSGSSPPAGPGPSPPPPPRCRPATCSPTRRPRSSSTSGRWIRRSTGPTRRSRKSTTRSRANRRRQWRETGTALLLLLPLFVLVVGLIAYPFARAIWLSFTDKLVGYPERWVGLRNYIYLAHDDTFHAVVRNSLVFTVASVALKVIIALTWRWMFDAFPGRGFFNSVLLDAGILTRPIAFMATPEGAMAAVVVANWWRGFPFFGVSYLAGMQSIPGELYEAAAVDGASAWRRFWHITLPGLKHVMIVTILLTFIFTLNDFNIIYVMTRGGPG